ncbi:MAG: HAD-IIIA family hydrolase [candidate division Zixibacteria bacterium]|nr:HAD-IIIA family hydrolase [candidate division Zixibacteria bacterium]
MQTNTLVVRFGSLGDVILTSATVLSLKIAYPGSRLTYLTKERFRSVVEMFDGVDKVVTVSEHASTRDLIRILLDLDNCRFDRVVDLHGNFRSWLARSIITANHTVIYPKRRVERWRMTLKRKTLPSEYPHTIDLYNQAISALDKRAVCRRPVMYPPALDEQFDRLLATDRPIVVIAPGAAYPNKAWPIERFMQVARGLCEDNGVRVLFAVTSDDPNCQILNSGANTSDLLTLTDCPLDQLAAIVIRAKLVVANDSGVAHLASAVGTPTLAIFGPTHPALGFAPRGLRDRVVEVDEPCRPCSRHGRKLCYRDERYCFTRITTENVLEQAAEILEVSITLTPALFVDRDGTVIENKHYLADPDGVELIEGAASVLKQARESGYKIVVVSNQSGVARGYYSINDVERVNARMLELLAAEGATVDAVYYCPHHEREGRVKQFRVACDCRKPGSGMGEAAALDLGINLRESIVVGDSLADINLGRVLGARPILIRTGHGSKAQFEAGDELERLGITVVDTIGETLSCLSLKN